MNSLTYLAYSIPWTCVGLLAGYLLGRGFRELELIPAVTKETDMNERSPGFRSRIGGIHLLGVVVFLLATATLVQGYVQNEQTKRVSECTRGYSNGFADALDARSKAATAEREALVQWMRTLDELMTKAPLGGDPAAARQRFAAATSEYLKKQAELRQKQQENPYPDPPRDICK